MFRKTSIVRRTAFLPAATKERCGPETRAQAARISDRKVLGLCAVAVIWATASLAQGQASFQGVGDLPGGETESFAYGVSGDGSTVVGVSLSASGEEAFRFRNGAITGLGELPGGAYRSLASGASFDGSVIVGAGTGSVGRQAVVWSGGSPIPLPGLLAESTSEALGVSANGDVVVGWSTSTTGLTPEVSAVRWVNGTADSLGDLPGGEVESRAQAVSANGATIIGWGTTTNGIEGFRWAADVMDGLGFLPGGSDSQAFGISADGGHIAGYSWSNGTIEAVVWQNGTPLGLGFMAGGSSTEAVDLSADGKVVVGAGDSATGAEAFVWDARHGIRPLRQLLVQQYGLNLDGWSLEEASAISDDGRTIVGTGTNPAGQREGWVARLPVIVPADFDEDGDVDGEDVETFHSCGTGPGIPYGPDVVPSACPLTFDPDTFLAADFDKDRDIDQADFATFQRCVSGQGVEPESGCEQ